MASRSVNKVILIGNLGRDAETRFTAGGVARTTFPLATSRRVRDQQTGEWREETDWHNVVVWRQENLANYLTKGKQVYVEGRLRTRNYEDRDGRRIYITEVIADQVILLGGRGAEEEVAEAVEVPGGSFDEEPITIEETSYEYGTPSEDDVPF